MSFQSVSNYLKEKGFENNIMEFSVSSATVELAAKAIGCEERQIAKTMSFKNNENIVLIVLAGDVKVDNQKYKAQFGTKAIMLKPDELEEKVGHQIGGVCPFCIKTDVDVYIDESIKKFEYIYPACGSSNSAVKLTPSQLFNLSGANEYINVSKEK